MRSVVALDLDDVLLECVPEVIKFHNERYGTSLRYQDFHSYEFENVWGGTREEAVSKCDEFHRSRYARNMFPVEGAVSAVRELSRDHELHVVTARNQSSDKQTRSDLETVFPPVFEDLHFTDHYSANPRKKIDVCKKIDAKTMVDDNAVHLNGAEERGIYPILLTKPWNVDVNHFKRADTWSEIVDVIRQV